MLLMFLTYLDLLPRQLNYNIKLIILKNQTNQPGHGLHRVKVNFTVRCPSGTVERPL